MPSKLKPCPFCGLDSGRVHSVEVWYEEYHKRVECENCGAMTGIFRGEGDAIAAWNRRATTKQGKLTKSPHTTQKQQGKS